MLKRLIIFCAEYLPFVIAAAAALHFAVKKTWKQNPMIGLHASISALIALVLDKSLNKLIDSPRPFVLNKIEPLFAHSVDNGFPSEHTLFACFIASIVFVYDKRLGVALFGLAILVGFGQMAAQVHHSIDVVGSILIAITSVALGYYISAKISKNSV